ncbi:NepR family anti-sigma factor [Palleronia marisminoris]|nr:NepR family anti-sigma factor [Palleronia marisminoris]
MSKDNKTSNVMRQIDENLRRVYFENNEEDIPDRFKELLAKLKNQDGTSERDSDG